jgi:hypothetical protein
MIDTIFKSAIRKMLLERDFYYWLETVMGFGVPENIKVNYCGKALTH